MAWKEIPIYKTLDKDGEIVYRLYGDSLREKDRYIKDGNELTAFDTILLTFEQSTWNVYKKFISNTRGLNPIELLENIIIQSVFDGKEEYHFSDPENAIEFALAICKIILERYGITDETRFEMKVLKEIPKKESPELIQYKEIRKKIEERYKMIKKLGSDKKEKKFKNKIMKINNFGKVPEI